MTCHNYPTLPLMHWREAWAQRKPLLVWALDNGSAGERAMKICFRSRDEGWRATAARPAETDNGKDWNDLHLKERLTEGDPGRYRYYGKLLLAASAFEKPADVQPDRAIRV